MTRSSPWDEIKEPQRDYTVRLLEGCGPVPLYWGKDTNGKCLFVLQLEGDHTDSFFQNRVSVHGIRVDLRVLEATKGQCLLLTLEQHVDRDLFFSLCDTLAAALKQAGDSSVALSIALTHLHRWKAFFANRRRGLLTAEQVRGLFAELQFLQSVYRLHMTQSAAVSSWYGPDQLQQDFIFGNTAVEVKAVSGKERNTVKISSEDQLDSMCDDLFLELMRISELPDASGARSLNSAVAEIYTDLTDSAAIEEFSDKLASYGYVELREYDKPMLLVTERRTYKIGEGFPRLIRSELPQGIRRVGYEIEIESIASFECKQEQVWRRS